MLSRTSITEDSREAQEKIPEEPLDAALWYAARGIPVFPCRPAPDKSPLTRHGFQDATTDPEQIRAWWIEHPDASIGVPTGVRFWVLDEDVAPDKGIDGRLALKGLEGEHGRLPDTYTVRTPRGGRHLYFQPAEGVTNKTGDLPQGLDVRGMGTGYVLVPPSPDYEVATDLPVAPAPDWLLELVKPPRAHLTVHEGQGQGEVTRSRFRLPERILESMPSRNRTLFGYGCSLRAHGWNHAQILEELEAANAERCVPPMDDAEVKKIARSAASHQPGNASTVAPEVLEAVALVGEKIGARAKKGTAPHSRWAAYRALLDCAREHGWMHGRDVAVRYSRRQHALDSGLSLRTLYRALEALFDSGLVYPLSSGEGTTPGVLVVRVPRRGLPDTTQTTLESHPPTGVTTSPSGALYRLRYGAGRLGKVKAALLEAVVDCGAEVSRAELCERLGSKPNTLGKHLKVLVDRGLVERTEGGRYRPADDWERVLDRERTLGGEKKAENLDRQRYQIQREAYRLYLEEKRRRLEEREEDPREAPAPDDGPQEEPDAPHEEEPVVDSVADVLELARSSLGVIPPKHREDPPYPAPERGRDPLVHVGTKQARRYGGVRERDLARRKREGLPPWIRLTSREA